MNAEVVKAQEPGWFWKLFGGTLVSLVGMLGVTVVSLGINSMSDMRQDIARINRESADCIKKSDFDGRVSQLWLAVREASALKEKVVVLEGLLQRQSDDNRSLNKELQALREKVALMEGKIQTLTAPPPSKKESGSE